MDSLITIFIYFIVLNIIGSNYYSKWKKHTNYILLVKDLVIIILFLIYGFNNEEFRTKGGYGGFGF